MDGKRDAIFARLEDLFEVREFGVSCWLTLDLDRGGGREGELIESHEIGDNILTCTISSPACSQSAAQDPSSTELTNSLLS